MNAEVTKFVTVTISEPSKLFLFRVQIFLEKLFKVNLPSKIS